MRPTVPFEAKRSIRAGTNPQSLLRYQRPLLEGESISYDFFYDPGEAEVHPSLGRVAFLIEPNGVRVHWITDGTNDFGSADNVVVNNDVINTETSLADRSDPCANHWSNNDVIGTGSFDPLSGACFGF